MLNSNKDHTSLIQYFYEIIDKMPNCIFAFISTFLCGLIVHGFALVNPPLSYDAVGVRFGVGATSSSGRWFLDIIDCIQQFFGYNYVIPFINILLMILFISLSAYFAQKILNFNNKWTVFFFSFLMISTTALIDMTHFVYTIHVDAFAILLSTLSAYFVVKDDNNKILNYIIAIILLALSLGIYQAYITFTATLLALYIFIYILNNDAQVKTIFKNIFTYVLILIASLILYLISYKLFCIIKYGKTEVISGYMGMPSGIMPKITLDFIKMAIMKCYGIYLMLPVRIYASLNTTLFSKIIYVYIYLLILCCYIYVLVDKIMKRKYKQIIIISIILFLLPIVFASIKLLNVMQTFTRMTYTLCFLFTLPCILFFESNTSINYNTVIYKFIKMAVLVSVFSLVIHFTIIANGNYYDNYLGNQMSTQYATQMINRIEQLDGFKKGMPIFIDKTTPDTWPTYVNSEYRSYMFDKNTYNMFDETNFNLNIKNSLQIFGGFAIINPTDEQIEKVKDSEEYQTMTYYPSDGSVKIINDVIVVKID